MTATDEELTPEEILLKKHRKERKELQSQIQALKKSVMKGDRRKRKGILDEILNLEIELNAAQNKELENLELVEEASQPQIEHNCLKQLSDDEAADVPEQKPLSKAQKRRIRIALQAQEREQRIKEQEIVNLTGVRNIEMQAFDTILAARGLRIHEISSNGHCLFASVLHQYKFVNGCFPVNILNVAEMRKRTAEYIRAHKSAFLPFMSDSVSGNPLNSEQFMEYCDRMAMTSEWGGQIEIRAMSDLLNCPIEVIQVEGPIVVVGDSSDSELGKRLIITFHRHKFGLGAHYNSTVPINWHPESEDRTSGEDIAHPDANNFN